MDRKYASYRAIVILCIGMLMSVGFLCLPATAWADPSLTREQVVAFLDTEEARRQTAAFVNMDASGRVNQDEIAFSTVAKVRYVRTGSVASEVPYFGNFEWHAAVSVDGTVRGSIVVWNDNGNIAVGGFDPTIDEAEALPADPDALMVVDLFNKEWYVINDGTMSALNDAGRRRLPEPMTLEAAAAKVSAGREPVVGVTADGEASGGEVSVNSFDAGRLVPWIAGGIALIALVAAALFIGGRRSKKHPNPGE